MLAPTDYEITEAEKKPGEQALGVVVLERRLSLVAMAGLILLDYPLARRHLASRSPLCHLILFAGKLLLV
jgi:hypothetical protein